MAKLIQKQLAEVLYKSIDGLTEAKRSVVLDKFAKYLVQSGLAASWPTVAEQYLQYAYEQQGVVTAEVTSARPLKDSQLKLLSTDLAQSIGAKKIIIETKIDPELLGGVIIRLPDRLLDASYRRQLRDLQAKLLY
ncbi:MAG TPA: ATP synthase F1 subunit delta [bacterium]|nr:ATP synthase F1 subunit delta [bacterium]